MMVSVAQRRIREVDTNRNDRPGDVGLDGLGEDCDFHVELM